MLQRVLLMTCSHLSYQQTLSVCIWFTLNYLVPVSLKKRSITIWVVKVEELAPTSPVHIILHSLERLMINIDTFTKSSPKGKCFPSRFECQLRCPNENLNKDVPNMKQTKVDKLFGMVIMTAVRKVLSWV